MPSPCDASGGWFEGFLTLVWWDFTKHSSPQSLVCHYSHCCWGRPFCCHLKGREVTNVLMLVCKRLLLLYAARRLGSQLLQAGSPATAPAVLGAAKALAGITEGLSMLFARAVSGRSLRTLPGKKNKIVFQQRSKKSWPLSP